MLTQLSRALNLYPKYSDALILRAKLLSKLKRYYDAIEDLNKCIKLEPNNVEACTARADCLRFLGQFNEALIIYSGVLEIQFDTDTLLKRAITFIENGNIEESIVDLDDVLKSDPKNAEAFLFKGTAYAKGKNYNEAILSFEQAIKINNSKKATTKSLYEIVKLKI